MLIPGGKNYPSWRRGTRVVKKGNDSYFEGRIVGKIKKLNGSIRYIVENEHGTLYIANLDQLRRP